jgi:hypothetical protein
MAVGVPVAAVAVGVEALEDRSWEAVEDRSLEVWEDTLFCCYTGTRRYYTI